MNPMESLYEIDDVTGMTSGRGFSSPELLNLLMNTWRGSSVKHDTPIAGLYLGRSLYERPVEIQEPVCGPWKHLIDSFKS